MSSGQKPRWPQFYPHMKRRGKGRSRQPRITLYDTHWQPVWPPVLAGVDMRTATIEFTSDGHTRRLSGQFWEDVA